MKINNIYIHLMFINDLLTVMKAGRKDGPVGRRRSGWLPLKWRDMRKASQRQSPRGLREADSRLLLLGFLLLCLIPPSLSGVMQIPVISSVLVASEPVHSSTFLKPKKSTQLCQWWRIKWGKWDSDDNDDNRLWMISLLLQWHLNVAQQLWNRWVRTGL